MGVLTVKLNSMQVLAIACFGVALGIWLKRKLGVLDRLNIPASIAGGMVYAVAALALRDRYLNLEMDMALREILMVSFFTTIGMSASLRLIRVGGLQVLYYFGLATLGALLQNVVGLGGARLLGIDPLLGIISGSVALTGGPATALAFGETFEKLGVTGASTLGLASATFGITAGGILGGAIGGWLIRRYRLRSSSRVARYQPAAAEPAADPSPAAAIEEAGSERSAALASVIALAVAMGIGTLLSAWFSSMGAILPSYIGAMIAAAIIRNLDDHFRFARISPAHVEAIGNIALYIFIVMALLTLRLWELVSLALPMLALLLAQVALVWVLCVTLSYWVMGRDYEAAVMSAGYCGFMLGTTANAMACMDVLAQKHGPAPRAFLVVPLVGAFLADFTNALLITAAINWVR